LDKDSPTLEEWRRLYQAAVHIKEIAPWNWMTEDEIFGVQNPETDELGFISVMGMRGEHYSIAVYLGAKGLYGFWEVENAGPDDPAEQILEVPQLQASFEDRNVLRKEDRDIIKQAGLKFRGKNAWPLFRSYRPGFFPWFVEANEARLLTYALEQAADVTSRVKEHDSLLHPAGNANYLVRVAHQQDDTLVWEDRIMSVLPPEPLAISMAMDLDALEHLKSLPQNNATLEIDFFMFPAPIQEGKDARPVFPYALMCVDAESGTILDIELLMPDPSIEAMWGQIPLTMVNQLVKLEYLPSRVKVRTNLLYQLLTPLAQELRFRLKQTHRMRSLNKAKNVMFARLG